MGKKLVIVESPSKSKTIEKYLGRDYKVVSFVIRNDGLLCDEDSINQGNNEIIEQL